MSKLAAHVVTQKVDHFVSKDLLDRNAQRQLKQFLEQVELTIFNSNREVIHREIPDLDRDSFIRFAVRVAEARARYVKCGLDVTAKDHVATSTELDRLRVLRLTYEELLASFEATQRIIERGYVNIAQ
ncbi:MAG: hypothetical protein FJX35_12695 [Alphaproteobacteria bacterium]|nr:hypothetical protein [Alphaproteobacteria bacterium]